MTTVLLILVVILALYSVVSTDLLNGVFALSAISIVSALIFILAKAPDVAITEAAVGSGVSTFIFVWAIRHTRRKDREDQ
ncbi:hydrogenase subunit MbhD domain-containing protein [uncultured Sphaerochaeta sp.]|uniref:Na(+)/H(+) antiporter subunit B n=1 Tax=uncultured Sphaerochaeta sp. TaxID=886478 RepID=UPI002A0A9E2E|nr:hydrogenase subunit MbhD domain-containing protein [uncultured Sphaerochaeta sp.]